MSRQNRQTAASISFASLLLFSIGATVFHGRSVVNDNHSLETRGVNELFSSSNETVQQNPPIVLLTGDPLIISGPAGGILSSPSDGALYVIKDGSREVTSIDSQGERSSRRFGGRQQALAIGSDGRAASVGSDSQISLSSSNAKITGNLNLGDFSSMAFLKGGDLIVAKPIGGRLLHVFSPEGHLLRSFGPVKNYGVGRAENLFLQRANISVDSHDNIYLAFAYLPLVLKFGADGSLQREIKIEGAAVDLQTTAAARFFSYRGSQTGGITILNSATIDPLTDHLWIALNGSTKTGVLYEYDGDGQKVNEYALQPRPGKAKIIDPQEIAINRSGLFVLASQMVVKFDRDMASAKSSGGFGPHASTKLVNAAMTFDEDPPPCGTAQTWNDCSFACPGKVCSQGNATPDSSDGSTKDCKAVLQGSLGPDAGIVVNSTCNPLAQGSSGHLRGACSGSVTTCKDGNNVLHSTTIDCDAPVCGGDDECGCLDPYVCFEGLCTDMSPILIDLNGNGFDLTDAANGVTFDINGDGIANQLSWTAANSDDAWLALDRNGNGLIDDGRELFGNFSQQPPSNERNGFLALAEYDKPENGGNSDGVIDRRDAIFSSLRLWQDVNHNGVSEASEMHGLPELGVESLALNYKTANRTDQYGNRFRYRAKVDDAKHSHVGRWAWDVFLTTQ